MKLKYPEDKTENQERLVHRAGEANRGTHSTESTMSNKKPSFVSGSEIIAKLPWADVTFSRSRAIVVGLLNENIRGVTFAINPKDVRLGSCCEGSTKIKAKILFTVPIGAKPVQSFPDCHVSRK